LKKREWIKNLLSGNYNSFSKTTDNKMMKKKSIINIFFPLIMIIVPVVVQAQDDTSTLPRQFRQFYLGMDLDDLKKNLSGDSYFNFRGDRDVSLLPVREQSLVETSGSYFIRRAFFQLRDGSVFIMSFTLNTQIIDYYSVFTQFIQKYGEPSYLDPGNVIWETEQTRIAIERPLTVKYIDKITFDDILNESSLVKSGQVRLREDFLNEF
jgi:hypothetical protein